MKKRGLVLLAAAAAFLGAVPATARVLDHIQIPDAAGDGDPDITNVTVGSNASGAITFVTTLGNRTELAENEFVFVLINSDNNPATGEQPNGADFYLQLDREDAQLFRWDGTAFVNAQSQTVYGYIFKGFRIAVNKSDLGITTGEFGFWVETQSPTSHDDAPSGEIVGYTPSATPIRLTVAQFAATAKSVKVGKAVVAGMQVHRSDLDEIASAGEVRCVAKVGTRTIKTAAAFPEDIAACRVIAPKLAKKKTIKLTVTLLLDGQRVSRTASIKVT